MHDEQASLFPEIKEPDRKEFATLISPDERPRHPQYMTVPEREKLLLKPGKWMLWCPYCGRVRQFKKHPYSGTRRCEGCGVSTRDFAVRQVNQLWLK